MLNVRLYMLQRLTALIMVPLVVVHIVVMIYAIQGGLSAAEILGRTKGSILWLLFYGSFVLAAAVHGAIGLRVVIHETLKLKGAVLELLTWLIAAGLAGLGLNAVWAVTL